MNDTEKVREYVLGMIGTPKQASEIAAESHIKVDTARRHLQFLYETGKAARHRVRNGAPSYYYVRIENADLLDAIDNKVAKRKRKARAEAQAVVQAPQCPPDLTGRTCAMGVWF